MILNAMAPQRHQQQASSGGPILLATPNSPKVATTAAETSPSSADSSTSSLSHHHNQTSASNQTNSGHDSMGQENPDNTATTTPNCTSTTNTPIAATATTTVTSTSPTTTTTTATTGSGTTSSTTTTTPSVAGPVSGGNKHHAPAPSSTSASNSNTTSQHHFHNIDGYQPQRFSHHHQHHHNTSYAARSCASNQHPRGHGGGGHSSNSHHHNHNDHHQHHNHQQYHSGSGHHNHHHHPHPHHSHHQHHHNNQHHSQHHHQRHSHHQPSATASSSELNPLVTSSAPAAANSDQQQMASSSLVVSQGQGQGPPHYVDLHVNAGECVSLSLLDGQEQVVAGPAVITMVSQQQSPPVPIPVQVPPGHMIYQIADENGTLKHIILSVMAADDGSQPNSTVITLPQGDFRMNSQGELVSASDGAPLTGLAQQAYFANYDGCPIAYDGLPIEAGQSIPVTSTAATSQPQAATNADGSENSETLADKTQQIANDDSYKQHGSERQGQGGKRHQQSSGKVGEQRKRSASHEFVTTGNSSHTTVQSPELDLAGAQDSQQQSVVAMVATVVPTDGNGEPQVVIQASSISDSAYRAPVVGPGELELMNGSMPAAMLSTVDGQLYGYPSACCCCCYCDPQEAAAAAAANGVLSQAVPVVGGRQDVIMGATVATAAQPSGEPSGGTVSRGISGRGDTNSGLIVYPMLATPSGPAAPMQAAATLDGMTPLNPTGVQTPAVLVGGPSSQMQNGLQPIVASGHVSSDVSNNKGHGSNSKGVRGGGTGSNSYKQHKVAHQDGRQQTTGYYGGAAAGAGHHQSYNSIVSGGANSKTGHHHQSTYHHHHHQHLHHQQGAVAPEQLGSSSSLYKSQATMASSSHQMMAAATSYPSPAAYPTTAYNHQVIPATMASVVSAGNKAQQQPLANSYRILESDSNYMQRTTRDQVSFRPAASVRSPSSHNESKRQILCDKSSNNNNSSGGGRYNAAANTKVINNSHNVSPQQQRSSGSVSPIRGNRLKGSAAHHHHQAHHHHHHQNGIRGHYGDTKENALIHAVAGHHHPSGASFHARDSSNLGHQQHYQAKSKGALYAHEHVAPMHPKQHIASNVAPSTNQQHGSGGSAPYHPSHHQQHHYQAPHVYNKGAWQSGAPSNLKQLSEHSKNTSSSSEMIDVAANGGRGHHQQTIDMASKQQHNSQRVRDTHEAFNSKQAAAINLDQQQRQHNVEQFSKENSEEPINDLRTSRGKQKKGQSQWKQNQGTLADSSQLQPPTESVFRNNKATSAGDNDDKGLGTIENDGSLTRAETSMARSESKSKQGKGNQKRSTNRDMSAQADKQQTHGDSKQRHQNVSSGRSSSSEDSPTVGTTKRQTSSKDESHDRGEEQSAAKDSVDSSPVLSVKSTVLFSSASSKKIANESPRSVAAAESLESQSPKHNSNNKQNKQHNISVNNNSNQQQCLGTGTQVVVGSNNQSPRQQQHGQASSSGSKKLPKAPQSPTKQPVDYKRRNSSSISPGDLEKLIDEELAREDNLLLSRIDSPPLPAAADCDSQKPRGMQQTKSHQPSIKITMRTSFSENNIQSLEVSHANSAKSTQTTPQKLTTKQITDEETITNGSSSNLAIEAITNVASSGSSKSSMVSLSETATTANRKATKGDKRKGTNGAASNRGKDEHQIKLSSVPQLKLLNLNCTNVTSSSVQLRWSYMSLLAEKYGIHSQNHNSSKNPALMDHFVIESSTSKNSETNTLISPKTAYQGCALTCRVNHLSAEKIYHFKVRRTALIKVASNEGDCEPSDSSGGSACGGEHLVVSEILSVSLPSVQQPSTSSANNKSNNKTSSSGRHHHRGSIDSSLADSHNQTTGHSDTNHHNHHQGTSSGSATSSLNLRRGNSSSHSSSNHHNHNHHHYSSNNGGKLVMQSIKFSNLTRQCRTKFVNMLGKLVQNSLSTYSDTKFAGVLLIIFTIFAMLLAVFIHLYIVAPVSE